MKNIERVVLVHRLREVIAQVGFTRFEAISPDIDGELEMGVRRASLTRDDPQWLPAIENRGEGIFIQFNKEPSRSGLPREDVVKRGEVLERGHRIWAEEHKASKRDFPRPAVHPDALVLAFDGDGGFAGMRLSCQFDPRTHLRHS